MIIIDRKAIILWKWYFI